MDKIRTKILNADNFTNTEHADKFLRGLRIIIDGDVVRQVVNVLSGKTGKSLYSLYTSRRDKPPAICGKGTVYKIKKLYDEGRLAPYVAYINQSPDVDKPKTEQTKESKEVGIKQEQVTAEQSPTETNQDIRLKEHFDELAGIARTLAFRQQWLLDNGDKELVLGNIMEGLHARSI